LLAAAMGFVGLFLSIIASLVAFAFALISGVFMIGVLFSFAIWVLTGQHAAFLSMLDFLGLRWVRFWRTDAKIGHSSGGSVWPRNEPATREGCGELMDE
jgi:hypothetical protein